LLKTAFQSLLAIFVTTAAPIHGTFVRELYKLFAYRRVEVSLDADFALESVDPGWSNEER
jgi:hypothetical protein